MSLLWFAPAIVLVIGAVVVGRQVSVVRELADETEVALAEAGEAVAVVDLGRRDLDVLIGRLAHGADAVGGPWRAVSTSATLMRGWWRRGRPPVPASDDVPSVP